ncbi:MAG: tetratricopeptide repeat protein [Planctomycetaceae bacterium]
MARLATIIVLTGVWGCRSSTGLPQARNARVQAFAEQAAIAEQRRDWQTATRVLAQAVEASPDDADLNGRLAAAQFSAGNRQAAMQSLRRAADLHPGSAEETSALGDLAFRMNDLSLADRMAQRTLEIDADHVDGLMLQARIAERRHRTGEAQAAYHRILESSPENSAAKLQLAIHEIDSGQPDQAAVLLRSVCNGPSTVPGEKAMARRKLGLAYGREGRWKDAARELQRTVAEAPQPTAEDWYQLAVAYRHVDRNDEAQRAALRALQIDGQFQPARKLLSAIERSRPASSARFASAPRATAPR